MAGKNFFISTARIEAFSDGVFAIVITLLAFQIKVPKFTPDATLYKNTLELFAILPNLIGFIFSFFFVAVFWVNHHQLYHAIKEADGKLLWYNIFLLFWISLIPFPIAVIGDHPKMHVAAMSLGIVLLMCSSAAYFLRRYSHIKANLVNDVLTDDSKQAGVTKNIIAVILNIVAIIAAYFSVYIAYAIYFTVLALFATPHKLETKSRSSKNKI